MFDEDSSLIMKRRRDGEPVFSCVCTLCGRAFRDRYNLRLHVRSMHEQTPQADDEQVGGGARDKRRDAFDKKAYRVQNFDAEDQSIDDLRLMLTDVVDEVVDEANERPQGLKYYLSMQVVFKKPIGDIETDPPPTFRSKVMVQMRREGDASAERKIDEAFEKMKGDIEEFTNQGSGWIYDRIENFQLFLFDYNAIRGGTYIPTPMSIQKKEAVVNVQNKDDRCFIWSILAALHPVKKNPQRLTNYKEYADELVLGGLRFPVDLKRDLTTFEDQNDISINIYFHEKHEDEDCLIVPGRISEKRAQRHVNLLLITNDEGLYHYVWIKNIRIRLLGTTVIDVWDHARQRKLSRNISPFAETIMDKE